LSQKITVAAMQMADFRTNRWRVALTACVRVRCGGRMRQALLGRRKRGMIRPGGWVEQPTEAPQSLSRLTRHGPFPLDSPALFYKASGYWINDNGPCAASSVPKFAVRTGTFLPALLTKEEHVSSCMSKNFESDPLLPFSDEFACLRSGRTAVRFRARQIV
jgi:hypothetical protein